jgi:hypothetical protein
MSHCFLPKPNTGFLEKTSGGFSKSVRKNARKAVPTLTIRSVCAGFVELLVPKKGLEPPHPCEYMDLNHARLPIPPLRHA